MPISYTKEQRAAKKENETLVSIDAGGPTFQGAVSPALQEKLLRFYLEFLTEARKATTQAEAPSAPRLAK